MSHLSESPFNTLEDAFKVLSSEPRPLALEAGVVAGLASRPWPLTELRAVLLHPSTGYRVRNQAIAVLLERARGEGGRWTVGLAGVLIFGLRRATSPLCDVCPHKAADIEAEALAGLVEGIAKTDPGRDRLAARLIWLARNRAKGLVAKELAEVGRPGRHLCSEVPARPYGHPDLVLVEAVAEGVIEPVDAALIGDTRLGGMSLGEAASALGMAVDSVRHRRRRAEARVVAWLGGPPMPRAADPRTGRPDADAGREAESSGSSGVRFRASTPYLGGEGRPRSKRANDRRPAACQPPTDTRR
jgi:DNA-directed RNA polymerase specialized sigma24 family protein